MRAKDGAQLSRDSRRTARDRFLVQENSGDKASEGRRLRGQPRPGAAHHAHKHRRGPRIGDGTDRVQQGTKTDRR